MTWKEAARRFRRRWRNVESNNRELQRELARANAWQRYMPGGTAWTDFLGARARLLLLWRQEGRGLEYSAKHLSMDEEQARAILEACDAFERF